jgi:hypothetical protein
MHADAIAIELTQAQTVTCPKCGNQLCQEIDENKRKVILWCEKRGCNFGRDVRYKYLSFRFVYRDEFTTEITARTLEDAIKKLDSAVWQRSSLDLWHEYLEVKYYPVIKLEKQKGNREIE